MRGKQRREAARSSRSRAHGAARDQQAETRPETRPDARSEARPDARQDVPAGGGTAVAERPPPAAGRPTGVRAWWPVLLVRASHPRQAVLVAVLLGVGVLATGRAAREAAVVAATALVGQAVAGWHHDLVDRRRDARHEPGRPLTDDRLDPGTVWFAVACGLLVVVPLAVATGVVAGVSYLAALLVTLLGNVVLRRGVWSWLPWAASFALYPAYLTYGGWGGDALGAAPSVLVTVLAGLLGVALHLVRSAPGLVRDHEEGWRTLPVRLALRIGASRVLALGVLAALALTTALGLVATGPGLAR